MTDGGVEVGIDMEDGADDRIEAEVEADSGVEVAAKILHRL